MKLRLTILSAIFLASFPVQARDQVERPGSSAPVRVQLDAMPIGPLVTMLMRDVLRVPYVIAPDVLQDGRPASVNLVMPRGELPQRVVAFLRGLGLVVKLEGGTVYVSNKPLPSQAAAAPGPALPGAAIPAGNPLVPSAGPAPAAYRAPGPVTVAQPVASSTTIGEQTGTLGEPAAIAIIEPANLGVLELVQLLEPVMPQVTFSARSGSQPMGSTIADQFEPDRLVMSGVASDLVRASELVQLLDRPRELVSIKAAVFEVRNTKTRQSAMQLLADVLGSRVQLEAGALPAGDQFLRLATGGVSLALSATRTDGRFQVVAEPTLTTLSGRAAAINSGSQVPTLGAVTFSDDGSPIRSVVYRDSGVSLTVRPVVRGGLVELQVEQERSVFVPTRNGVDDSPTLNKSSSRGVVRLAPGEAVAFAGLDETSSTQSESGFLGGILGGKSRDKVAAQLIVMVQADILPQERATAPKVTFVGVDLAKLEKGPENGSTADK